jgi:hypothetical protein
MQSSDAPTRHPIPYAVNPTNWMPQMLDPTKSSVDDLTAFDEFMQSLKDNPVEVLTGIGGQSTALVPFNSSLGGPIVGNIYPVLGDGTQKPPDPCSGYTWLDTDQLKERITKLKDYLQNLHATGGVKMRVMPYIDFGPIFFGRHTDPAQTPPCTGCPAPIKPSVRGFWDFYDQWQKYSDAVSSPGLGPKPPLVKTWLRKWWLNDDGTEFNPYPLHPDLIGLSMPDRDPKACDKHGPYYRYAVCPNTLGWKFWWKQVVQWVALVEYDGVYIDNPFLENCWNNECQSGYRTWLDHNFTSSEISRYFITATNNLLVDPSIEAQWRMDENGHWGNAYWGSKSGSMFPDTVARHGRYCCRIEAQGATPGNPATFSHIVMKLPDNAANKHLSLSFYYKAQGNVQVTMTIAQAVASSMEVNLLTPALDWTNVTIDFYTNVPTPILFNLSFKVTGTGQVWLDEFWLGEVSKPPTLKKELLKPDDDIANQDHVRKWAAKSYWSQASDDALGYLRTQAYQINPKFALFTNGYHAVNVDYFMTEEYLVVPELDFYRKEQQKDVCFYPGIYTALGQANAPETKLVDHSFGYKYIHSLRDPNHFAYHMPMFVPPSEAEQGPVLYQNADSARLNLAETAAFGDGTGCDAANLIRYAAVYKKNEIELANIRQVENQFWNFIQQHQFLYTDYHTHADVGIVFHTPTYDDPLSYHLSEFMKLTGLAKELAGRGILWDVLTENRCNAPNFARLRVLIYQDVFRISAAEAQAVQHFLELGGLVIAAATVGDMDEWFRMRLPDPAHPWPDPVHPFPPVGKPPVKNNTGAVVRERMPSFSAYPIGAGQLIYYQTPPSADQVLTAIKDHLGRTVQMVDNISPYAIAHLRLNAWFQPQGSGRLAVHIVNYNVPLGISKGGQVQKLDNVVVSCPLSSSLAATSVRLYSPESNGPAQVVPFQVTNGLVTFTIPSLRIYTVALVE